MIQKVTAKRGRPISYDRETVLGEALAAFWDSGYTGTTIDEIATRADLNRPSLYGAFGDKHALYCHALTRYQAMSIDLIREVLSGTKPLRQELRTLYARALAIYLSGERGQRGCFLIGTAVTESVRDPVIRERLAKAVHEVDTAFAVRLRLAQKQQELPPDIDANALGQLASAVLQTLAVRARAGATEAGLRSIIANAVLLICGPAKPVTASAAD